MKIDDNFFMSLAINEAWKYQLLTYPNPAVGCVVVKEDSQILSIAAHKSAGESHAELLALKEAYLKINKNSALEAINKPFLIYDYLIKNHNNFLNDCKVYVTLEPCSHVGKTPSCANLLKELFPKKVIISQKDKNEVASGGLDILKKAGVECKINCMEKEGYNLLLPFLKFSKSTFLFYKMAQTLNGTVDGGYISSNQSLAYVHALRDKIDLLVIGGNTVRIDKPTLDARYIDGKAPKVLIYSNKNFFDRNIPLFKVPNREVIISNDVFKILDHKFVMIEGTYTLLEEFKDKIDYLLLLVSPKMKNGLNANVLNIDFEVIHENYIGKDKMMFLKVKNK